MASFDYEVGAFDWQLQASCLEADSELFFMPDRVRPLDKERRIQAAKAVCAICPVLLECRSWALQKREPFGVWGGMSEKERQNELRSRDIQKARNSRRAS